MYLWGLSIIILKNYYDERGAKGKRVFILSERGRIKGFNALYFREEAPQVHPKFLNSNYLNYT